jgi:hypothetical protein
VHSLQRWMRAAAGETGAETRRRLENTLENELPWLLRGPRVGDGTLHPDPLPIDPAEASVLRDRLHDAWAWRAQLVAWIDAHPAPHPSDPVFGECLAVLLEALQASLHSHPWTHLPLVVRWWLAPRWSHVNHAPEHPSTELETVLEDRILFLEPHLREPELLAVALSDLLEALEWR